MEQDAWTDQEEAKTEAYQYFMRTDPGMREFLGPIQKIDDPVTGREIRCRDAKIGMLRNTKPENMKDVVVYLDPHPHIRTESAKDLQGWYSPKTITHPGMRPRPCFTDAVLTQPYGGYCPVGCGFSLPAGELVDTPLGFRKIETLREGEFVWGRDILGVVLTQVRGYTKHWQPKGYLKLKLSDGRQINLTNDHPVYSVDRGTWIQAGKLRTGERLETIRFGRDGAAGEDWVGQARGGYNLFSGSQVGTNSEENESLCAVSPGGNGSARERPQERGLEISNGGKGSCGDSWIQDVPAMRLQGSAWTDSSHALGLGGSDCDLVGQSEIQLGIRTHKSQFTQWSVYSRLSADGRAAIGSEGLQGQKESFEANRSAGGGLSGVAIGPKETKTIGNIRVETITQVDGGLYVYDIQTPTQNFYQRGILVHNCYINAGSRGYRGSGLMSVPLNYGEHVRKQLKSMNTSAAGYFSSFTDPFQEVEDYYHNTYEGAKAFVELGLPIFFLSRLSYPDWAYDLLMKNPHSYAQKSINTPDEEDWRKLSPGAATLETHFAEIKELHRKGIYVSIQVNPIIAGVVTHDDIELLFEKLAEAGADHVIVKFVEANIPWSGAMVEKITKRFGANRAASFRDLFTENSCGAQRTVDREYRLEGIARYQKKATKLGLTFSLCYEYDKGPDGKWRSIGKDWHTSDQCHGHRVPMYVRMGRKFEPLGTCPPSGCLHCAEDAPDEKPRCGSELLGQAKDLLLKDFRKPFDGIRS